VTFSERPEAKTVQHYQHEETDPLLCSDSRNPYWPGGVICMTARWWRCRTCRCRLADCHGSISGQNSITHMSAHRQKQKGQLPSPECRKLTLSSISPLYMQRTLVSTFVF